MLTQGRSEKKKGKTKEKEGNLRVGKEKKLFLSLSL